MLQVILFPIPLVLPPPAPVQPPKPASETTLAFRLEPGPMRDGVPSHFDVVLRNVSGHDLILPKPAVECSDTLSGAIWVYARFVPADPTRQVRGRGCIRDGILVPVLDRVKRWQTLHAGESVSFGVVTPDAYQPGQYTVWAAYEPAYLSAEDRETLHQAGMEAPADKLETPAVQYRVPAAQ